MLEYVLTDDDSDIVREDICNRLKAGQVGIVPTETVYGLVCLADNEDGHRRIAAMKKRENRRSMQFLVSSLDHCEWLDVSVTEEMRKLADRFWPGPLTLVVTNKDGDYVGIRVPRNDLICNLINDLGQPLSAMSASSAGISSKESLINGFANLDGEADFALLSGESEGVSSTVIRLHKNGEYEILQEGAISEQAVKEALES